MQRVLIGLVGMLAVSAAQGQDTAGTVQERETELATTATKSPEELARLWGLSPEEYHRYQETLAGPRGRLSAASISPIEVLGIEATTPAERDRYAELWVEMIRADTGKALAFSRSVQNAWQRLYPDEPLIDRRVINDLRVRRGDRPIPLAPASKIAATDQILLFTDVDCQICSSDLLGLIEQVKAGVYAGLDIYVLDVSVGDVAAVQRWAGDLGIPPELVRDGTLSLNIDDGTYQTLTDSMQFTPAALPVVMRRRGETYDLVSLR